MKLKKNIVTGISVIIVGSIGFFYSNVSQPPFIHITTGKGLDTHRTDSTYWYIEDTSYDGAEILSSHWRCGYGGAGTECFADR